MRFTSLEFFFEYFETGLWTEHVDEPLFTMVRRAQGQQSLRGKISPELLPENPNQGPTDLLLVSCNNDEANFLSCWLMLGVEGEHLVCHQNASAGSSISVAQPDSIRVSRSAVSGSIRSAKNRPVTSLRVRKGFAPSAAILSCATLAILAHM